MAKTFQSVNDRTKFASEVAKQTGLSYYVVYVWSLAKSTGNTVKGYSFLGFSGKALSGVATTSNGYSNVKDAATEAAYRINHVKSFATIKASAGKSNATQLAAIKKALGLNLGATAAEKSGKASFSVSDLTAKNPVDTATSLLSGSIDTLGKKVIYAFAILGGGLLAIMGLVLIGADVGISELNRNKGVRTVAETAGIGGAILKAGSKESRATRAHAKSEKHLTKVRRSYKTEDNEQRAKNLKAGKPEHPKTETHKLTAEEKATKKQIKHSAQGRIYKSTGDDIPF